MSFGEQRTTRAGEVIFEAGAGPAFLVVVLGGQVAVVDRTDGAERQLFSADPGEFVGELVLLSGQTAYATCIVVVPGEVLIVPAAGVRAAIVTFPALSDVLVAAFAARRQLLISAAGAPLALIGAESAPHLLRLLEFVSRNRLPHRTLEPDDPAAVAVLDRVGAMGEANAWVVVRGQVALADPSPLSLAKALGLYLAFGLDVVADIAIVALGPAGLAAVYGASEGLCPNAVDDVAIDGQAGASSRIENYLGFPTGISDGEMTYRAEVQALKFRARIAVPHRATGLHCRGDRLEIELDGLNKTLRARSVVIASGARYRRLGLPHQEVFEGTGICYAATELEARRCRNDEMVVVGGGNSAGQAAMYLAGIARRVHLTYRVHDLAHSMSRYLISRLESALNVRLHFKSAVRELEGDDRLRAVTIVDGAGHGERIVVCALFVMIGSDPCTDWLHGKIALDERGFVLTGTDQERDIAGLPLSSFQTSQPGVCRGRRAERFGEVGSVSRRRGIGGGASSPSLPGADAWM